jgi:hypothetical protein
LDWQNVLIHTNDESLSAYNNLYKLWQNELQEKYATVLKRWLAGQFSASFFPFAGLGETLAERATIIGVRFAILQLAIMSASAMNKGALPKGEVVRIVQSLSRFLDHLASPVFLLQICAETGWDREPRMCGLFL